MKLINHFLWWCAGANTQILTRYPSDHAKYFGMGLTIFLTSVMAFGAGGYAFHTVFEDQQNALLFGLFWGLVIFNLDRYIVSTTGRGDGTPRITFSEAITAFPRLMMAILLGFIISTPLELRIFHSEIEIEISEEKSRNLEKNTEQLNVNDQKITELKKDIESLNLEISEQKKLYNTYRDEYIKEGDGSGGSGKVGIGYRYQDKLERFNQFRSEFEAFKKEREFEIEDKRNKILEISNNKEQTKQTLDETYGKADKLLSKIQALHRITERDPVAFWIKWLITILFIFIEVSPVLFKMMSESGAYEDWLYSYKNQQKEAARVLEVKAKIEADYEIEIAKIKNQERTDQELKLNREILNQIYESQLAVAKSQLTAWQESEVTKSELKKLI